MHTNNKSFSISGALQKDSGGGPTGYHNDNGTYSVS